jgi:hypothetical protein
VKVLTEDARLVCLHRGVVRVPPTQALARVNGRRVLVEADPEDQRIAGCPNAGPTIKPCTTTLKVQQGYASLLRIDGRRACLDAVTGLTDGTPPGTVAYQVDAPGQDWVEAAT